MKENKILIIVTNEDTFNKEGIKTGLWFSELTKFWDVAQKDGYKLDIASPKGGYVPIDPQSLIIPTLSRYLGIKGPVTKKYIDKNFMHKLNNSLKISELSADDYDAIYLTGGHGVMFDFTNNDALSKLISNFYTSNKVVSAVCHGPSGLLNVRLDDGNYLIKDKQITGFSWMEEILARLKKAVPFNMEKEIKNRQGKYKVSKIPFTPFVVEDGNLITGQNPLSAKRVGKKVINKLK